MSGELIRRCAWCGDVHADGRWQQPKRAPSATEATHGICERCFAAVAATCSRHRKTALV
jgi:hypothetical protein